ncbi:AraC family transcriptional regulator [Paenibacillus sp. LHD-38]|uniref:AraC family transcriptional regulator n=1 Tax=Paenibacillus sp. LHD-38 TaxID=3072143 RepID=UPI00280FC120|nr:AraC family transcriptional regulator [Paenibacillus sp. LHD-38]MDQ8737685.1 AraC family transcriptional regulator [Paenibacillus sp. LHD-38]
MQTQRLNVGGQLPILLLSSIRMRKMRKRHAVQVIDKNTFALCAVTAGSGLLHINECSLRFHPGELFFFTPGTKLDTELHSESAQYTLLLFRQMTVSRTKGKWAAVPSDAVVSFIPSGKLRDEQSAECMGHVARLYADSRSSRTQPAALQLQALGLLHALLEAGTSQKIEEEASSGMDESIAYMYKHYDKKLNLETLSAIAGLTPTSYSRSFKRSQCVSPIEFLNQIRIERAKEQLSQPDNTVKNVSALVGFGNEFYFSRLFKRSVGITPTLFIKRKELSVAVVSNYQYHENLYSLGASCVYAMNGFKYVEQTEEFIKSFIKKQLQELRQASPDIIIVDHRHQFLQEQLSAIAPTVSMEFTLDWRKNHIRIAELVGRESEARQNFAHLENQAKFVRQWLSGAIGNESVALLRLFKRKVRVQGMVNHPLNELLYSELGLKPGSCVPLTERNHEFTLTSLPVIETDNLLIHNHNVMQKEEKLARFQQTNAWKAISAVPHTKTLFIPNWIGMSWAPNGRERIMNELLDWSSSR